MNIKIKELKRMHGHKSLSSGSCTWSKIKKCQSICLVNGNGTKKTGAFTMMSPASRKVATARLRLACDTPGAFLQYYLGHSLRATAGMTAAYVN